MDMISTSKVGKRRDTRMKNVSYLSWFFPCLIFGPELYLCFLHNHHRFDNFTPRTCIWTVLLHTRAEFILNTTFIFASSSVLFVTNPKILQSIDLSSNIPNKHCVTTIYQTILEKNIIVKTSLEEWSILLLENALPWQIPALNVECRVHTRKYHRSPL